MQTLHKIKMKPLQFPEGEMLKAYLLMLSVVALFEFVPQPLDLLLLSVSAEGVCECVSVI